MIKGTNEFMFLVLAILYSCSNNYAKQRNDTNGFKSVRVLMKMVSISNNSESILISDSTDIYHYKDFTIYKRSYINLDFSNNDSIIGGIHYSELNNPKTKYYYLLNFGKDTFCFRVDSFKQDVSTMKKLSLDSALRKNLSTNFSSMSQQTRSDYILLDSQQLSSKVNKYIFRIKEKVNASFSDSMYYYYTSDSNLLGTSYFSLARGIDYTKRGKLFKICIVYNKNPKGINEFEKMGKQLMFELKSIKIFNEKEVVDFIDNWKEAH